MNRTYKKDDPPLSFETKESCFVSDEDVLDSDGPDQESEGQKERDDPRVCEGTSKSGGRQ